jgi:FkbM family methyltransferase
MDAQDRAVASGVSRHQWWCTGVGSSAVKFRSAVGIARAGLRYRRLLARIAAAVDHGHPNWIGDILGEELPDDRRAILARMMSHEQMHVDFDRNGTRWLTDTGGVGEALFRWGAFEGEKEAAVIAWLGDKRGLVVDVGANLGTTTLAFARAGFSVVAVEAVPTTFEMLVTNVERNGFAELVSCVPCAIAETPTVTMHIAASSGQSAIAAEGVTVRAAPLAEVAGNPVLVWADVQGAETGVLRTGGDLWRAGVPAFLEVDPAMLDVDAFVEAAQVFSRFTPVTGLPDGVRPIAELRTWIATLDGHGDALFEP